MLNQETVDETIDDNKMVKEIVAAEKARVLEPVKRDPFRRLGIGYNPIRGRNVGHVRKSRGVPVIYRESVQNNAPEGQITMDRILVLPKRRPGKPKNNPVAQEKAEAKRNRKARRLEELVAAGGFGG